MGARGGRNEHEDGERWLFGGSYRGRGRGSRARKLQPLLDGSVFQTAEAADVQSARLHAVCVRHGLGPKRFVLSFHRFEYRGVWPSRNPRENGGTALWRRRGL